MEIFWGRGVELRLIRVMDLILGFLFEGVGLGITSGSASIGCAAAALLKTTGVWGVSGLGFVMFPEPKLSNRVIIEFGKVRVDCRSNLGFLQVF